MKKRTCGPHPKLSLERIPIWHGQWSTACFSDDIPNTHPIGRRRNVSLPTRRFHKPYISFALPGVTTRPRYIRVKRTS